VLPPDMIELLQELAPDWKWPETVKVRDVCGAIAKLGGHLKHNGRPGWLTLMRGFKKLLMADEGWRLAIKKRGDKS